MQMSEYTRSVIFVTSFRERLQGLLFTKPHDAWFVFSPCKGVHTFGMRFPIDIAFLDREGMVLASFRGVGPKKRFHNRRAVVVVERFESNERWFAFGDRVDMGFASVCIRSE